MLRAYFGHHKCASTWVWQILAGVCREIGLRHRLMVDPHAPMAHGPLTDYSATFEREALGGYLRNVGTDVVSCINADQSQLEAVGAGRGVHVIRDPRDIIVSAYFSHRNSHPVEGLPHLAEHRERLRAVPQEEGIFLEMDFSARELDDLATWDYDRPDVLELTMEALTDRPYEGFIEIFAFFELLEWDEPYRMKDRTHMFLRRALNRLGARPGLSALRRPTKATGDLLLGMVYQNRFETRARGRKAGEENVKSHYRKGVAGDWANHFTSEHVAVFKERYGNLLVRLGYEEDYDWGPPVEVPATFASTAR